MEEDRGKIKQETTEGTECTEEKKGSGFVFFKSAPGRTVKWDAGDSVPTGLVFETFWETPHRGVAIIRQAHDHSLGRMTFFLAIFCGGINGGGMKEEKVSEFRVRGSEGGGRKGTGPISREELLGRIRAAVKEKGRRVGRRDFLKERSVRERDLNRHFAGWDDALRAAGCNERAKNAAVTSAKLLENWGMVAEKVGRVPTEKDYLVHGSHAHRTLCGRFGSWNRIPEAFVEFANNKPEWRKVLTYTIRSIKKGGRWSTRRRNSTRAPRRARRLPDRPVCGERIDHEAMLHAPANEQGVVFLFAMMARRLGFYVVGLQTAFPDCLAMRELVPGSLQPVRIEFEYESRNFQVHRHRADGCEIIVCWEHNWKECPKNLEVIALKDEIERFGSDFAKATSDEGYRWGSGNNSRQRYNSRFSR